MHKGRDFACSLKFSTSSEGACIIREVADHQGSTNVSFLGGHSELVKRDRLWQLYWHKDYQPPAKRPGLP